MDRTQVTYRVTDTTQIGKYAESLAGSFRHRYLGNEQTFDVGRMLEKPFFVVDGKKLASILRNAYGDKAAIIPMKRYLGDEIRYSLKFPAVGLGIGIFPTQDDNAFGSVIGHYPRYVALAETVPGGILFSRIEDKSGNPVWGYKTQDYFEKNMPLPLCTASVINGTGTIVLNKDGNLVASSGGKMDSLLKETARHVDQLAVDSGMNVGSLVCGVKVETFGKQFEDYDGQIFGGEGSDAIVTVSVTQIGKDNKEANMRAANEVFATAYNLREEVKNKVEDEIYARFIA